MILKEIRQIFWSDTKKGDGDLDCWEWLGDKDRYGAGLLYFKGKKYRVNRISYEIDRGRMLKNGDVVLRTCENTSCHNPLHLVSTDREKFFSKVEIRPDGCWIWTGAKVRNGYGSFRFDGTTRRAHRVSFSNFGNIEIPAGMIIMHSCDNPACVNPEHLSLGTEMENAKDKMDKGRRWSKISEKDVVEIRNMYKTGNFTLDEIGKKFDISFQNVSRIVNRTIWKDIE